jgi:hypothetical protein
LTLLRSLTYALIVASLTIHIRTSHGRVLSGGSNGGVDGYVYQAPPGFEIAGFFGRSGEVMDAIGVVLRAI